MATVQERKEVTAIDTSGSKAQEWNHPSAICRLPCEVPTEGDVEASNWFFPEASSDPQVYNANFRGRKLAGIECELPSAYEALVLRQGDQGASSSLAIEGVGRSLVQFNHDFEPSQSEAGFRALEWLTIADALHTIDRTGD